MATYLVYQLQTFLAGKLKPGNWYLHLIPYGILFIRKLVLTLSLPDINAKHYNILSGVYAALLLSNAHYYYVLMYKLFGFDGSLMGAFVIIILLVYICRPPRRGIRCLYPILPFIVYFLLQGRQVVCSFLGAEQLKRSVYVLVGIFAIEESTGIIRTENGSTHEAYTEEMLTIYLPLGKRTPE